MDNMVTLTNSLYKSNAKTGRHKILNTGKANIIELKKFIHGEI